MDVNYAIWNYISVNGWIKHHKSERYMYKCFYQNKQNSVNKGKKNSKYS